MIEQNTTPNTTPSINRGPTYREWLEVITHSRHSSFADLQAMAQRIDESRGDSRLTEGQVADLLERLGDLQVEAAQREENLVA